MDRKPSSSRFTTEQCRVIDAFQWTRNGILGWGFMGQSGWRNEASLALLPSTCSMSFAPGRTVRIIHRLTERGDPLEYHIRMQTTEATRNGIR